MVAGFPFPGEKVENNFRLSSALDFKEKVKRNDNIVSFQLYFSQCPH
jgi:hypothetical protein